MNTENISSRSRASSVISTGTKFSISTMPHSHFNVDGLLEGNIPRSTITRPTSLYSVRSTATSLPPYEGHQPVDRIITTDQSYVSSPNARIQDNVASGTDPEQPTTPSDPENALSMHYGRVVRTIDENHARQLARIYQAHEQELAATRNAIDEAYRKEFKAKNREIERVREEAANNIEQIRREAAADVAAVQEELETLSSTHDDIVARIRRENTEQMVLLHEEHQAAIEKARNAIEDLWEGRWHDRTKVAAIEAKRAADEAQRREVERDRSWLNMIETRYPDFASEIKAAMQRT